MLTRWFSTECSETKNETDYLPIGLRKNTKAKLIETRSNCRLGTYLPVFAEKIRHVTWLDQSRVRKRYIMGGNEGYRGNKT